MQQSPASRTHLRFSAHRHQLDSSSKGYDAVSKAVHGPCAKATSYPEWGTQNVNGIWSKLSLSCPHEGASNMHPVLSHDGRIAY